MSSIIRLAVLLCIATMASSSFAADITVIKQGDSQSPTLISLEGDLVENDEKLFAKVALPIDTAIVIMAGNGGNLVAGIQIGKAIRLKQFDTLVMKSRLCASACALAWLGGERRFMEPGSKVGFHAAYRMQNGKAEESGVGNAITGSYLNQLNLPNRAVEYITSKEPQSLQMLTLNEARKFGIDVIELESDALDNQSVSTPPARQFTISDGKDLFGLDLPGMPLRGMTLETCQSSCVSNSTCQAFTFNRKSSTCFLKSGATFSVGYEFAMAGYPPEIADKIKHSEINIHQRTDVVGLDFKNTDGVTLEQCIRECDDNLKCRAFTFIAKQKQCWLKSSYRNLAGKRGVVSGLK